MIPISDELKSAVLHEVTPKNVKLIESRSMFSKSVELLNWYSDSGSAGISTYTVTESSLSGWKWFWSGSSGDYNYNVVNTHFGDVKYVYFIFQLYPQTPTSEVLNLHIKSQFRCIGGTTGYMNFESDFEYVNDGLHKFGYRVDGDVANNIISENRVTEFTISNITENNQFKIGNPQIFLSDDEYDFDEIPDNFDMYATEENIEKYIPQTIPTPPYSLELENYNWYNRLMYNDYTASLIIDVGRDTNLNYFSYLKPSDARVDYDYINKKRYACFSFEVKVKEITSGDKFAFRMSFKRDNGLTSYNMIDSSTFNLTDFTDDYHRVYLIVDTQLNYPLLNFYEFWILNKSDTTLNAKFDLRNQMVSLFDNPNERPEYTLVYASDSSVNKYLNVNILDIDNRNIISESLIYKESICSAETLKFGLCEASEIEIDVFDKQYDYIGKPLKLSLQIADVEDKFEWDNFIIAEAKKTYAGDIQKRHIIAYDKLKNLNENAYAWYTQYMWGINVSRSETYYPYMFDYPRQIFSTYWNLANKFGIDSEVYITKDDLGYHPFAGAELTENRDLIYIDEAVNDHYLRFYGGLFSRSSFGDNDAFIVTVDLVGNRKAGSEYARYLEIYDSLGRGIESANVLLEFVIDGEAETINYLCDSGDVVLPPANWTGVHIFAPSHLSITSDHETMANGFYLNGVKFDYLNALDLVNGTQWLPYFSYVWRKPTTANIFKADSSITARDVMRSLMEMCGCFFRLNREGHPQFLYAMEHGLYPSNTLFPADDLFPRKSSELTMPTSYYIKANFEEYRVSNFGGVQVVVNTYDSQGAVVRWEYWGDETSDNAYLIDDNIFLCNSQFEYEPEMAGNVQELLENLWNVLNNMSYTPFTAETIGTPFLESGDRFTLLTKSDGFESFIFERTLKGIQVLKDYYEARGVAKTPRVKNFEWGNTNE